MASVEQSEEELVRALVRSAERDAAPAGASDRAYAQFVAAAGALASGVGAAGLAATAPDVGPRTAAATAKLAFGLKCAAFGVVAGSALTYAWLADPQPSSRPTIPSAALVSSPSAEPPARSAPATATGSLDAALVPSASAVALVPPLPVASPSPPAAPVIVAAGASNDARSLAAEVAALDEARAALGRSPQEALERLARYRRTFPRGKLAPEAEVLAVEAHAARGDRARAKAAADAFLRAHPSAPQRARIVDLTEAPPAETKGP